MTTEQSDWQEVWDAAQRHLREGRPVEAEALLNGLRDRTDDNDPRVVGVLCLLAQSIGKQRPWNVMLATEKVALEHALRVALQLHGEGSKQAFQVRKMLAASLHASERTAEALEHMLEVVEYSHKIYGDTILFAHELAGLADMYLFLGGYDDAIDAFRRSQAIAAGDHPFVDLSVEFGLGRALLGASRTEEAILELQRACDRCARLCGEHGRRTSEMRVWLDRARLSLKGNTP